jgi:hypothetical protein
MATIKKPRRVRTRDLSKAITLRPREVFELYGINQMAVSRLIHHADEKCRLKSTLIPGRCGRKGIRLINHDELRAFLARHAA